MPFAAVSVRKTNDSDWKRAVLRAVRDETVAGLNIPQADMFARLSEMAPGEFLEDNGYSDKFTLVELSLFGGRTDAMKRDVVHRVTAALERLGVPPRDVHIIFREVARTSWASNGEIVAYKQL